MNPAAFGLCLNARKGIVDKQDGADPSLPGPGHYIDPIVLQGLAQTRDVAPSFGFGTSGILTHGRPVEVEGSPVGPQYQLDNITFGKQVQTRMRSAPNASFGSGPQRYHGGGEMKNKCKEPSPQQYDTEIVRNAIFKLSTKRTITGVKFSTGPRTYNDANAKAAAASPAPGQYKSQSAIGGQVESKFKAETGFTLASGNRDFVKKGSTEEPGPGKYIDPIKEGRNARGEAKSVLSRQKSFPSAVFGTGNARPSSAPHSKLEKRPGPNQYVVPGAMGTQVNSRFKSSKAPTFGAR